MSINHLLRRINVKRDMKPAVYTNDLSIELFRIEREIALTQIGIQKKMDKYHQRRFNRRDFKRLQSAMWRKLNPERARQSYKDWYDKNPSYHREWRKNNADKVKESSRKYKAKTRVLMTKEQKQKIYADRRAAMIEKHGLDGWRVICSERNKQSQLKRKLKNESSKS